MTDTDSSIPRRPRSGEFDDPGGYWERKMQQQELLDLDREIVVVYPDPSKMPASAGDIKLDDEGNSIIEPYLIKERVTVREFLERMPSTDVATLAAYGAIRTIQLLSEDEVISWIANGPK